MTTDLPESLPRKLEYYVDGKSIPSADGRSLETAHLAAGGHRPPSLPVGDYLSPTVFCDVTPEMAIFREEIFGPVVCVSPVDDEGQAVHLADATTYGLAGR